MGEIRRFWVKGSLVWLQQFVCIIALAGQSIELAGTARFMFGDQDAYKNLAFDDSQWKPVAVPASWSAIGFEQTEHRFGWYRIHFNAPRGMANKVCILLAGIIDDSDETYLNGVRIGKSGKFPPNDQTAWDVQRKYTIPKGLLKGTNVLAIKVYNGVGGGGLYAGKLQITTQSNYEKYRKKKLSDLHSYHQLTTSNGLVTAVYNDESNSIEAFYPHIFSYHDSARAVLPVLTNLRSNLTIKPQQCSYLQNTHIVEARYAQFSLYYFTSFTRQDKVLYILARGDEAAISHLDFKYEPGNGKIFSGAFLQKKNKVAEKYFVFTFTDALQPVESLGTSLSNLRTISLLDDEIVFMRKIISDCHLPAALSTTKKNAAEQSIAILKMSQVSDREIYPLSHGQILASLRPGVWAISWVRDAAYAIQAMSSIGMYGEAKKGLEFMLKTSPTSQYVHYIHTDGIDYGIGVPYQISVTRYFGNGREESDYAGETGPNIEIDDFGLFLMAFCHYVQSSDDREFYDAWRTVIHEQIARPILHNLTNEHILRRDSGPWEHHLPGKQFVFTDGVCARGLQLLDALDQKYGMQDREITEGVDHLLKGIAENFLVGGIFYKGNAQDTLASDQHYFDAASFELFACGLLNDKAGFKHHMREYDKHLLAAKDPKRGYIRFDSNDSYENQEWPFAGLRVAVAEKKLGDAGRSKQLIDRITTFASRNHNQIPEIIGLEELDYKGAIPMVGYGAGAYLLALMAYYSN